MLREWIGQCFISQTVLLCYPYLFLFTGVQDDMRTLFTFLFTLLAIGLKAQLPPLDFKAFQQEFEQIVQRERMAYQKLDQLQGQGVSGFSNSSNNFTVYYNRLEWNIDPSAKYIRGKVTAYFTITTATPNIVFDLHSQLIVDSVIYHGLPASFLHASDHTLRTNFPSSISAGTKDSISIYYKGVPDGSGFGSFYQGTHAGVPVVWTLSEPYGARDWWPCKNGLDDKMDSVDIIVTSPSAYRTSANGLLVRDEVIGANRICHFKHKYRMATYLVAIAVTNYVVNNDTIQDRGKQYSLISHAYPEGAGTFFGNEVYAKNAFRLFNTLFIEYPFASEKYGHTQFGWGGGMEHQTNSFMFNTSPQLSAHELAHQWFGDYITCGSWSDIWLNEGFATFNTALFLEYLYPANHNAFLQNALTNIVSDPGGSVYVYDTTVTSRIFNSRLSYNKGMYVLRMLRWVLGDSSFFKGVRNYLNDPKLKFGFARTPDLQRHLELESGKNLQSFFQKWVYQQGYPNYHAEWWQNTNNWIEVKLNQATSHPSVTFFEMPVKIVLQGGGQSLTKIVDHRFSGQKFSFSAGFPVESIQIDPEIWILAKTKTSTKVAASTTPNELSVSPNPAPRDVQISLKNPTDKKLTIRFFNMAGQLVHQKEVETPGNDMLINFPMQRFARGMYWISIRSEKINFSRKIAH